MGTIWAICPFLTLMVTMVVSMPFTGPPGDVVPVPAAPEKIEALKAALKEWKTNPGVQGVYERSLGPNPYPNGPFVPSTDGGTTGHMCSFTTVPVLADATTGAITGGNISPSSNSITVSFQPCRGMRPSKISLRISTATRKASGWMWSNPSEFPKEKISDGPMVWTFNHLQPATLYRVFVSSYFEDRAPYPDTDSAPRGSMSMDEAIKDWEDREKKGELGFTAAVGGWVPGPMSLPFSTQSESGELGKYFPQSGQLANNLVQMEGLQGDVLSDAEMLDALHTQQMNELHFAMGKGGKGGVHSAASAPTAVGYNQTTGEEDD